MRRAPIDSTRTCSTASNTVRAACASGSRRRWVAASWQASFSAMESAWPRTMAASRGLSLRAGSGRRALAPSPWPITLGLSGAKVTSSSGVRDMARMQAATARLKGSCGLSAGAPGLRLDSGLMGSRSGVGGGGSVRHGSGQATGRVMASSHEYGFASGMDAFWSDVSRSIAARPLR